MVETGKGPRTARWSNAVALLSLAWVLLSLWLAWRVFGVLLGTGPESSGGRGSYADQQHRMTVALFEFGLVLTGFPVVIAYVARRGGMTRTAITFGIVAAPLVLVLLACGLAATGALRR